MKLKVKKLVILGLACSLIAGNGIVVIASTTSKFPVKNSFRKDTILMGYKVDNRLIRATVKKATFLRVYKALDNSKFKEISKKKFNKITYGVKGSWKLMVYTQKKAKSYHFVRNCVYVNGKYYQAKAPKKIYRYFGIK